jgi:hypothetical protein
LVENDDWHNKAAFQILSVEVADAAVAAAAAVVVAVAAAAAAAVEEEKEDEEKQTLGFSLDRDARSFLGKKTFA